MTPATVAARLKAAAEVPPEATAATAREQRGAHRSTEERTAAAVEATLLEAAVDAASLLLRLQPTDNRKELTVDELKGRFEHTAVDEYVARCPLSFGMPVLTLPPPLEGSRFVLLGHGIKGQLMQQLYGQVLVAALDGKTMPSTFEALFAHKFGGPLLHLYLRSALHRHPNQVVNSRRSEPADIARTLRRAWDETFATRRESHAWHAKDRHVREGRHPLMTLGKVSHWAALRSGTPPPAGARPPGAGSGVMAGNPVAPLVAQLLAVQGVLQVWRVSARPDLWGPIADYLGNCGGVPNGLRAVAERQRVVDLLQVLAGSACGLPLEGRLAGQQCTRFKAHCGSCSLGACASPAQVVAHASVPSSLTLANLRRSQLISTARDERFAAAQAVVDTGRGRKEAAKARGLDEGLVAAYMKLVMLAESEPTDRVVAVLTRAAAAAGHVPQLLTSQGHVLVLPTAVRAFKKLKAEQWLDMLEMLERTETIVLFTSALTQGGHDAAKCSIAALNPHHKPMNWRMYAFATAIATEKKCLPSVYGQGS